MSVCVHMWRDTQKTGNSISDKPGWQVTIEDNRFKLHHWISADFFTWKKMQQKSQQHICEAIIFSISYAWPSSFQSAKIWQGRGFLELCPELELMFLAGSISSTPRILRSLMGWGVSLNKFFTAEAWNEQQVIMFIGLNSINALHQTASHQ